jgi:hypothetical protein
MIVVNDSVLYTNIHNVIATLAANMEIKIRNVNRETVSVGTVPQSFVP